MGGLTHLVYRTDERVTFSLGIIADLDPVSTGRQFLFAQHDDDETYMIATREAFGSALAPVRDRQGRISAFANNLKDLQAARRELAV